MQHGRTEAIMARTTIVNRALVLGVVGLWGVLGSGCVDDGGLGAATGTGDQTDTTTQDTTAEQTSTRTITSTLPGTSTDTTTPTTTGSGTSTVTGTGWPTTTVTATTTATSWPTSTLTNTNTVTKSQTSTTTSIATAATTGTYTQTITQVATYNDYTLVRRSLPPLWVCPAGVTTTGMGGAGGSAGSATPTDSTLTASDCASLANLRRPILEAQAQSRLDQARASLISANCRDRTETVCLDKNGVSVATYYCGYGGSVDAGVSWGAGGAVAIGGSGIGGSNGSAGSTGATEYSTTNTQVASVDEADYIKNDGNTIFVLSSDGLHVIDAWPAAETHEVAHLSLPGNPRRMFLLDNRLVVYTQLASSGTPGSAGASNPSDQGCTYGYDCRFSSEGGRTQILVYDVTAPASPIELMRYEMSGGYVASRRIGSNVYTVVHDSGATEVPGLIYTIQATSYEDMEAKYAQQLAANKAKIELSQDDFFLPWITMTKPGAAASPVAACQYALATQFAQGGSFISINTFDLTTLGAPTRTLLASNAGYVYASPTSLYMAIDRLPEQSYSSAYYYSSHQANDSFVHKFKLDGTSTSYVGSVTLPGHILNQFAMDESDGVLRVASTKGWVPSSDVSSYVTTYGMQAGKLTQLGQVGNIAPQEDIRSVRFDGNRGYVVTFKKTDPLFVFDLTDASKPTLTGELLIPGFSTYMHPLDDTHILAIGFTADDMGSYAYFNGIQIQIFDVSVLSDPKVLWKKEIGTRGSNSEALTNSLAFNYFAPKKMLALPITVCDGGGNGSYGTMSFAGLMAFDISLDTGIAEHGRLPFVDQSSLPTGTGDCNKWWTNSKSLVKRSIFMDDFIYALSDAQLRVAALASMNSVLQSVPLVGP
jgi:uncharacterized secreted protein with C-terminal beta-propeller domain